MRTGMKSGLKAPTQTTDVVCGAHNGKRTHILFGPFDLLGHEIIRGGRESPGAFHVVFDPLVLILLIVLVPFFPFLLLTTARIVPAPAPAPSPSPSPTPPTPPPLPLPVPLLFLLGLPILRTLEHSARHSGDVCAQTGPVQQRFVLEGQRSLLAEPAGVSRQG